MLPRTPLLNMALAGANLLSDFDICQVYIGLRFSAGSSRTANKSLTYASKRLINLCTGVFILVVQGKIS